VDDHREASCYLFCSGWHPDAERIEKNYARSHALGVTVYVTELDVRIPAPVTEE
jgi:GH35 family endo-1,4-beta-xylanase